MLAKDLFSKIGFTDEWIIEYKKYNRIFGDRCDEIARKAICGNLDFKEAFKKAEEIDGKISPHTAHLMFLLECTGYVFEEYKRQGIDEKIFYMTMYDITCKIQECIANKGVFGTFTVEWFEGFFKLKRFALGRLQYDMSEHQEDTVKIGDYIINKGDFVLKCHIPSGAPLLHEQCLESFKMAYEFFKEKIKDDILLIECSSWLLFLDYQPVFKENSKNIYAFAQNFHIYGSKCYDEFRNGWRIFNVPVTDDNINELPADTRLQRGFLEYLKDGGKHGDGLGVILFDGVKILK